MPVAVHSNANPPTSPTPWRSYSSIQAILTVYHPSLNNVSKQHFAWRCSSNNANSRITLMCGFELHRHRRLLTAESILHYHNCKIFKIVASYQKSWIKVLVCLQSVDWFNLSDLTFTVIICLLDLRALGNTSKRNTLLSVYANHRLYSSVFKRR